MIVLGEEYLKELLDYVDYIDDEFAEDIKINLVFFKDKEEKEHYIEELRKYIYGKKVIVIDFDLNSSGIDGLKGFTTLLEVSALFDGEIFVLITDDEFFFLKAEAQLTKDSLLKEVLLDTQN